jgi:hypothetical protein
MTTFTLKDYVETKDVSITVDAEPIPFAGIVTILDQEEREEMLRHQLDIVKEECNRLKRLLAENGIKY